VYEEMSQSKMIVKSTAEKLSLFGSFFTGQENAYGTYDPATGRSRQVKELVTEKVFKAHLTGRKPYGVFLLVKDQTRAIAVDFDTEETLGPKDFVDKAKHYGISAHVERSKSKGYHVWVFFEEQGVPAVKARLVANHILHEIEAPPETEVFPKQDALNANLPYGNFINAPLFGALVPREKTVFVDPKTFKAYPDQWSFLESACRISESVLNDFIEINDLSKPPSYQSPSYSSEHRGRSRFSLPVCAQKILRNGVARYQRVSCFRLAVHFKRLGVPYDLTVAALKTWALKNRPTDRKRIIRESEILAQTSCAYEKSHVSYGCEEPAIKPFCEPSCPVNLRRNKSQNGSVSGRKTQGKTSILYGRISHDS
jgi:hypothetical protein